MVPKEMDYFIGGAQGNQVMCNVQGFASLVGMFGSVFHNAAFVFTTFPSLATTKFTLTLRKKLSPCYMEYLFHFFLSLD